MPKTQPRAARRRSTSSTSSAHVTGGALRPVEAAAYIGVARRTFDKLVAEGQIDFSRIGAIRVFPKSVLDAYLQRNLVSSK
jgi:excisionase family DNA binding protein